MERAFQQNLRNELSQFLSARQKKFPPEDCLKIDLHCHDYNSNVPDELIGRILRVSETWLPSEILIKELTKNGCNAFTITNHNNARSCYIQQDKGLDILTAAEFSCWVPDFEIGIHVLAYGFTPEQETKLDKLRKNVYAFQEYTREHNIPTIWAHPLYHYSVKNMPPQAFFHKMLLLFERFETLNGQRDTWQNMLVREWIEQVSNEMIDRFSKEFDTDPTRFCAHPYKKTLSGGSDCHMGIFAGMTGSYLYVPDLQNRLKTETKSNLALEALRNGHIAPYGSHQNTEKLTIAFLNYACQIAINYKDPGLVRLLLHKGETSEKIIALAASNIFSEVKSNKVTMSFIKLFYKCMLGESPSRFKKIFLPSIYKPVFDDVVRIAEKHHSDHVDMINDYYASILSINSQLNRIISGRLNEKINKLKIKNDFEKKSFNQLLDELELPSNIRLYMKGNKGKISHNLSGFMDGLPFPFFASLFILAAHFTSAKTMFHTRPFLRHFSKHLGKLEPPKRILWLTDTFCEENDTAQFLQEVHKLIKECDLPIDLMTCHHSLQSDEHLLVLKPVNEFSIPIHKEQKIYIPNFVELHNLFLEGEYDRIICSTEGVMGLFGLYLKHAYTVEVNFYMHTDWLLYARNVLHITGHNLDRIRRLLRFLYKFYDRILVLNSEQKKWLTGPEMEISAEQIAQTSYWVNSCFSPQKNNRTELFGVSRQTPILLYVGTISQDKGVLNLPFIYKQIQSVYKETRMVVVGKGPDLNQLQEEIPDGIFIDWIEQSKLSKLYSSADLLLSTSKSSLFNHVILEALHCGLPVIAFSDQASKDMILHNQCGYLVNTNQEMAEKAIQFLALDAAEKESFKNKAIEKSKEYEATIIIDRLLTSVGINI